MKTILVTGGAGFIGSNFIKYMLDKYRYRIVNLDALTYAGNLENLSDIEHNDNYTFVKGDICDKPLLQRLFEQYGINMVVNFAAESHVDRSISDPEIFLKTNIMGTHTLLEICRHAWEEKPGEKYVFRYRSGVKFLQVSTDEVYGNLGDDGLFTEDTPLSPNSPYSASKASADMLVQAYAHTYGLPVNITRCSNNYGPYQFPEKLIPLMILNSLQDKSLPVYGNGLQVRDWLHVYDHCSAIDAVLHKGEAGEIYNIGGNNEKANIELVHLILRVFGKPKSLITHVADRPGHDTRYAIDNTKITTQLGWTPSRTFEEGLEQTIQWYTSNLEWLNNVADQTYLDYYKQMYAAR